VSTHALVTAFDKLNTHGKTLRLGPAVDQSMATPAAVEFRTAYQAHRRGAAVGAAGESPEVGKRSGMRLDEACAYGGVHGDKEFYAHESGYNHLLQWRLSYQAHRSGAARGARGEVGVGLSVGTVRMLPVARQAAHMRQLREKAALAQYQLSPPSGPSERMVHVHVGAGRLGLGLAIPALARGMAKNGGALVILQRPSAAWAACKDGATVAFTINGKTICRLKVRMRQTTDSTFPMPRLRRA